jgi:DNA-binding MarR family transcriptional regulator
MTVDYLESFGVELGKNNHHEEAVYGIALVYAALFNRISTYLDQYALTPAKMNALMIIKHQGKDKGISQIDIGKRLMVTASNMTRVLDKMEKEGLINRSAQAGDRRVKIIKVTSKGSKLMDQVWPGYEKLVKSLAGTISVSDQKETAQLLRHWFESLQKGAL